jgi:hypothetical protein
VIASLVARSLFCLVALLPATARAGGVVARKPGERSDGFAHVVPAPEFLVADAPQRGRRAQHRPVPGRHSVPTGADGISAERWGLGPALGFTARPAWGLYGFFNQNIFTVAGYHADGQILDEVFEFGSFLQSRMYAAGMGCTDCHDAHSARRVAEGNAVCTQCHSPAGNPRFATLRLGHYDSPEHHFHEAGSPGAACKNCHMTERVYMDNDWRANHSFRVPRPDLSAETAAPDACTTCHTDRNPGWAAAVIAARFPASRHRGPHLGQVFGGAWTGRPAAPCELAAIAEDPAQVGIVRATALWLIEGAGDGAAAARLAPLLQDGNPLVRAYAVGAQRMAGPQDRVLRLLPLLVDPARTVRIEAAKALLDAPIARLPGPAQADLDAAMADRRVALASRLDFPETHLQLAGLALTMRDFPQAEAAFREAVRLDPQRVEACVMLVRLAVALDGASTARKSLDEALRAVPNDPVLLALDREISDR